MVAVGSSHYSNFANWINLILLIVLLIDLRWQARGFAAASLTDETQFLGHAVIQWRFKVYSQLANLANLAVCALNGIRSLDSFPMKTL